MPLKNARTPREGSEAMQSLDEFLAYGPILGQRLLVPGMILEVW